MHNSKKLFRTTLGACIIQVLPFSFRMQIPIFRWTLKVRNGSHITYEHKSEIMHDIMELLNDVFCFCWTDTMLPLYLINYYETGIRRPSLHDVEIIISTPTTSISTTMTLNVNLVALGIDPVTEVDFLLMRDHLFLQYFGIEFFHNII